MKLFEEVNMSTEPVGKLIASIYRNIQVLMDQLLKDTNLSSGTLDFLYVIINNEGLSQKELSEQLRIGKATTAKAVKRLEDLDYITRNKSETDKRVYELYLTAKGQAISEQVNQIFEKLKMIYVGDFQDSEYDVLVKSLNKVLDNIVSEIMD